MSTLSKDSDYSEGRGRGEGVTRRDNALLGVSVIVPIPDFHMSQGGTDYFHMQHVTIVLTAYEQPPSNPITVYASIGGDSRSANSQWGNVALFISKLRVPNFDLSLGIGGQGSVVPPDGTVNRVGYSHHISGGLVDILYHEIVGGGVISYEFAWAFSAHPTHIPISAGLSQLPWSGV